MSVAVHPSCMYDHVRETNPALAEQYLSVRNTPGIEAMPTLDELLECVKRGTHEGVLESALHLAPEDYDVLKARVAEAAKAAKQAEARARRTRRRRG